MLGSGQLRAFVFDIGPMAKYEKAYSTCMLRAGVSLQATIGEKTATFPLLRPVKGSRKLCFARSDVWFVVWRL
jgi:hypothetical protein